MILLLSPQLTALAQAQRTRNTSLLTHSSLEPSIFGVSVAKPLQGHVSLYVQPASPEDYGTEKQLVPSVLARFISDQLFGTTDCTASGNSVTCRREEKWSWSTLSCYSYPLQLQSSLSQLNGSLDSQNIVDCRAVAMQRPRDGRIYQSRF
jgi:hypothetical protein